MRGYYNGQLSRELWTDSNIRGAVKIACNTTIPKPCPRDAPIFSQPYNSPEGTSNALLVFSVLICFLLLITILFLVLHIAARCGKPVPEEQYATVAAQ